MLLCATCPSVSHASAPALSTQQNDPTPSPVQSEADATTEQLTCDSGTTEDSILCDAHARRQDTIDQIIDESDDEDTEVSGQAPSSKDADDMWVNAYNQWIKKQASGDKDSASAKRALEAARKRHQHLLNQAQDATIQNQTDTNDIDNEVLKPDEKKAEAEAEEEDDDELKLITKSTVQLYAFMNLSDDSIVRNLQLIDDLCVSGDNGRQFAAVNGVRTILDIITHFETHLVITPAALRALASCCQNNAPVAQAATDLHAVAVLADIRESGDVTRASALKALLTLTDAPAAGDAFWQARDNVLDMIANCLKLENVQDANVRRCKVRSLALVHDLIRVDRQRWADLLIDRTLDAATLAMNSEDEDIKEGAAQVVKSLKLISSSST